MNLQNNQIANAGFTERALKSVATETPLKSLARSLPSSRLQTPAEVFALYPNQIALDSAFPGVSAESLGSPIESHLFLVWALPVPSGAKS